MNSSPTKVAAGLATAVVLCCVGPVFVALTLPVLAAMTGQVALVAGALVLASVLGVVAWRRRSTACATEACEPRAKRGETCVLEDVVVQQSGVGNDNDATCEPTPTPVPATNTPTVNGNATQRR